MHISDGILTETATGTVILGVTTVLAFAGTAIGIRQLDYTKTARAAVIASAFFVASLIHIKIGVASVHLTLTGLVGILLGWVAFPVFLIGLLLQTLFFGHGGITTLGLNTFNFATSAVICSALFTRFLVKIERKTAIVVLAFLAGALSVLISGTLIVLELIFTGESFAGLAGFFIVAHLPVALIEGLITAFIVQFITTVEPQLLKSPYK